MNHATKLALNGILVTTLLILALALPAFGGALEMETEDVVLEDGTVLTNSLTARSISIPADAHVVYAADVVLAATTDIVVEGRLAGTAGTDPGADAFDLVLDAGRSIRVSGSIVARGGEGAVAMTGNDDVAAGHGGSGGSINLTWGSTGALDVVEGAFIRSGDGGPGGDATLLTNETSPRTTSAAGGHGGRGGDLRLDGGSMTLHGTLIVGSGGVGGAVFTQISPDSPTAAAGNVTGIGGNGGPAGALALPPGYSVAVLHASDKLQGGYGGDGGNATSAEGPVAPAWDGACGSDGSWTNGRHASGERGCSGARSVKYGGHGGCALSVIVACLHGGTGGSVHARGGTGGTGGRGADGLTTQANEEPVGASGGPGGYGGRAQAYGGDGGDGILTGGNGGYAFALGGNPGNGGNGGDGGWTNRDSIPGRCAFMYPACWYSHWPETSTVICGHAGSAGAAGTRPGDGWRYPGAGGEGGLADGFDGQDLGGGRGDTDASPGKTGRYAYDFCDHMISHDHIW